MVKIPAPVFVKLIPEPAKFAETVTVVPLAVNDALATASLVLLTRKLPT